MLQSPTTQLPSRHEAQLIQIALGLLKRTKTAAIAALRQAGLPGRSEYAEWMLERLALQDDWHRFRHLRHAQRRVSNKLQSLPRPNGKHGPVLLPEGTVTERLTAVRIAAMTETAQRFMRWGAAGGSYFSIRFTTEHQAPNYEVNISYNRDTYRGRFKGWRATEDNHLIRVPADWRVRIKRRGLAEFNGLLTLDARQVFNVGGYEVYAATWARQGRGFSVVTEQGFIARTGEHAFHAVSAEKAVAGLHRKLRALQRTRHQGANGAVNQIDAFVRRYRRASCEVTLDDARDSGSCESGIRAWCETVGIDIERGSIPVVEVLAAYRKAPWVEARLAILHAVRRFREEKKEANAANKAG